MLSKISDVFAKRTGTKKQKYDGCTYCTVHTVGTVHAMVDTCMTFRQVYVKKQLLQECVIVHAVP